MTTAAVMLAKDEADIVGFTVSHLLTQVDEVIVSDNGSTDGTRNLLDRLAACERRLTVLDDPEVGYYQDAKTTRLARMAFDRGHRWVIPCDADEYWYAPDGRRIADWLNGLSREVQIVHAELYNHLPSALDPSAKETPNPFRRIGWRQRERAPLGKVACRCRPDLRIHMGNHSASVGGSAVPASGLVIRHYSWRSADQYLRKIRNGSRAYAATDFDESVGSHWRAFDGPGADDDHVRGWFREWFYAADPMSDPSLIYDPIVQGEAK